MKKTFSDTFFRKSKISFDTGVKKTKTFINKRRINMQLIDVGMCLIILFISGCDSIGSTSSSGNCIGGCVNACITYYYQLCDENNNGVIDDGDEMECYLEVGDKCGICLLIH
jgi:hypothetical protein